MTVNEQVTTHGAAVQAAAGETADKGRRASKKAEPGIDPQVRKLAYVLVAGALAVVFDSTIVSVALNTLARDFHVGLGSVQWVSTAYMLAMAAVVPLTGWAQNRWGGRNLWMFSLALFGVGSLGSSLSVSLGMLIACRVVQGAAGGIMLPVMQNVLIKAVGRANIGKMMATIGLPVVIGPILGPLIGGAFVTYTTWRWCFWLNIPFCVIGIILSWRMIAHDDPAELKRERLDTFGLGLVMVGVTAVVYGLSEASSHSSFASTSVILPVIVGLILLAAFVVRTLHLNKVANRDTAALEGQARRLPPLADLRLFKISSFTAASVVVTVANFALYGATLLMPLYYQRLRCTTPYEISHAALIAGIALIPQGIGTLLTRQIGGKLTDSIGAKWVVMAGGIIGIIGTLPFCFATATTPMWWLMIVLVVRGAGLGMVTLPAMSAAFVDVSPGDIPSASIITRTVQQIGGSFGMAVAAVLLDRSIAQGTVAHGAAAAQAQTLQAITTHAFQSTYVWVIVFTAITVVAAMFLHREQA